MATINLDTSERTRHQLARHIFSSAYLQQTGSAFPAGKVTLLSVIEDENKSWKKRGNAFKVRAQVESNRVVTDIYLQGTCAAQAREWFQKFPNEPVTVVMKKKPSTTGKSYRNYLQIVD